MSAFIVSDKTINQIVTKFINDRSGEFYRRKLKEQFNLNPTDQTPDRQGFGSLLMALNIRAVNERYEDIQTYSEYRFRLEPNLTMVQAYKSLQCWLYQCAEGTVPESELYQFMEEYKRYMADEIISALPEYDRAQWDAA